MKYLIRLSVAMSFYWLLIPKTATVKEPKESLSLELYISWLYSYQA